MLRLQAVSLHERDGCFEMQLDITQTKFTTKSSGLFSVQSDWGPDEAFEHVARFAENLERWCAPGQKMCGTVDNICARRKLLSHRVESGKKRTISGSTLQTE